MKKIENKVQRPANSKLSLGKIGGFDRPYIRYFIIGRQSYLRMVDKSMAGVNS
jgi:hypothetical protein